MINCLLIYSKDAGHRDFSRKLDLVRRELSMSFDRIDVEVPDSLYRAFDLERKAIGRYHSLIVVGGDGSFNTAVNALACKEEAPVLGYINEGTLGDVGKNFGVLPRLKSALGVISDGHYGYFDVGECGGRYFAYMAAYGRYSDIAYAVPRREKKAIGKFSYYKKAVNEALSRKDIDIVLIDAEGKQREFRLPFVLILNGLNVGGFKVNKKGLMDDGLMECYLTTSGPLNGLLPYLNIGDLEVIRFRQMTIKPWPDDMPWCLDGEIGPFGESTIVCHNKAIRVYCRQNGPK